MIIADTGFWLALADRRDAYHRAAVAALKAFPEPLITTWPVLTETCFLLGRELGSPAQIKFVQDVGRGAATVFPLTAAHLPRIEFMDLADASLVLLAEEIGSGRIFSTDRRDFHAYRWKSRKPFANLLGHWRFASSE